MNRPNEVYQNQNWSEQLEFDAMLKLVNAISTLPPADPMETVEIRWFHIYKAVESLRELASKRGIKNPYRLIMENVPGVTLEQLGEMIEVIETIPTLPREELTRFFEFPVGEDGKLKPLDMLFANMLLKAAHTTQEDDLKKTIAGWNTIVVVGFYPRRVRHGYLMTVRDVKEIRRRLTEETPSVAIPLLQENEPSRPGPQELNPPEPQRENNRNKLLRAAKFVSLIWKSGLSPVDTALRFEGISEFLEHFNVGISDIQDLRDENGNLVLPEGLREHLQTLPKTQ